MTIAMLVGFPLPVEEETEVGEVTEEEPIWAEAPGLEEIVVVEEEFWEIATPELLTITDFVFCC